MIEFDDDETTSANSKAAFESTPPVPCCFWALLHDCSRIAAVLSAHDDPKKKRKSYGTSSASVLRLSRSRMSFDDEPEPHVVIQFFSRYWTLAEAAHRRSHLFLSLSILAGLYVLARSFDAVLFIRVATKMHNYTWFLSQILFRMQPSIVLRGFNLRICSSLFHLCHLAYCTVSVCLVSCPSPHPLRKYRQLIADEALQLPKHRFMLLGVLNGT